MKNIIEKIEDRITGKAPKGAERSPEWPKVRELYIMNNPYCEICGGTDKLRVHHVVPFHISPFQELDPDNLVTLCERKKYGINCHLLIGHVGNFRRTNPSCRVDIATWKIKLGKI